MELFVPIAVFVVIGLVFLGFFWWAHVQEQKRRESLEAAAQEMGLRYSADGDPQLFAFTQKFSACNTGRRRKLYNLIEGETDELLIAIFDFTYTTGSGKNSRTHNHTMVMLRSVQLKNPPFTMRPENFFDRIGSALGFQDIDFETHPVFSESFVLKSPEEVATRNFFNANLLEHFEQKKGVSVEADIGAMIFYRPGKRAAPEEVKDLFEEAYVVFGAMVDRANS